MNMLPQKDKITLNGARKKKKKEKMVMTEWLAFDFNQTISDK
jgi:hypothetical protein